MQIDGNVVMKCPREDAFRVMTDPEHLSKAVPGCEKLVALGNDEYEMTVKIGVAAVKGTYSGRIQLAEIAAPDAFKMMVEGSAAPGIVKGSGLLRFADEGSKTKVFYTGDVQVSGKIAAVGNRFLGMIANMMIGKFFDEMGKQAQKETAERGTP